MIGRSVGYVNSNVYTFFFFLRKCVVGFYFLFLSKFHSIDKAPKQRSLAECFKNCNVPALNMFIINGKFMMKQIKEE